MPYKDPKDRSRYRLKWRQEHKEKGLCLYCSSPALGGHVSCEKHLKANRISGLKHYAKCKMAFRCVVCGKPHGKPGYYCLCEKCLEKNRKYKKTKRDEWRKAGRCITCGRPLEPEADENYKSCSSCRTYGTTLIEREYEYSRYSIAMARKE